MPIEETPTEDTVASGNHRLILHAGAITLGIMVFIGITQPAFTIFGH